jgi:hypothetical protein
MRDIVKSGMPGTKVHLFGSRAVGLHLPSADMDMVLQLPAHQVGVTQVDVRRPDKNANTPHPCLRQCSILADI